MDENAQAKPQYLDCNKVLTNHSMKPLLKRHFLSNHSSLKDKSVTYFEEILANMQQSRKLIRKFTTSNEKSLKASYLVSLRIAKTAQPHTIAERLILPPAKDLVENLIGEVQAQKLVGVPVLTTQFAGVFRTVDIFQVSDETNSTVGKLQLRLGDIEKNNLAAFPLLCEFISEMIFDSQLKSDIAQHCRQLTKKFYLCFPKNCEEIRLDSFSSSR